MRSAFLIAMKSLLHQAKRYRLLFMAISIGSTLAIIALGAANGALEAVKDKGARYFSGHVSVLGLSDGAERIGDPAAIASAMLGSGIGARSATPRLAYKRNDAQLFFNGDYVRQRKVIGIDVQAEVKEFAGLPIVEGSLSGLERGGRIVVSEAVARRLGFRAGDEVDLFLTTDAGQYNSARLVVAGIFAEASVFGYASYVSIDDMASLLGRGPGAANEIAVYADAGTGAETLAERVRSCLASRWQILPAARNREELAIVMTKAPAGQSFAVVPLDAQLDQIKDMLEAFMAVAYGCMALFLSITMAGIASSYRVMAFERRKELGTMRALGASRAVVAWSFVLEATGLGVTASLAGAAAGMVAMAGLHAVDLSGIVGAGLFLEGGKLRFELSPAVAAASSACVAVCVALAALPSAIGAGAIEPAVAMRAET